MKKQLLAPSFFLMMAASQTLEAQCYPVFKTKDVVYSDVYNLKMDIYQPLGAPAGARPLLVMAHGGSFVEGNKDEATASEIARRFASRGFTTASINYRLESAVTNLVDSTVAARAVIRAVSDMKAAVRYLVKDALTDNLYSVDTSRMYVGGNSAGAITAANYAYLEDTNDIRVPIHQYVRTVVKNNGGISGNSGNDGFYDKVKGVINLAGGVKDTAWIRVGAPSVFSAHGDKDNTVPYYFDRVLNNITLNGALATVITLCGSGAMKPKLDAQGITNELKTYVNADHVPWEGSTAIFNEIDSLAALFFGAPTCYEQGLVSSIKDQNSTLALSVYPNPATSTIIVSGIKTATEARIFNQLGQEVLIANVDAEANSVNVASLQKGVYILKIENEKAGTQTTRVVLR